MRHALIALAVTLSVAACSSAPDRTVPAAPAADPAPSASIAQQAVANLASASGSLVSGKVTLVPMGNGVHLTGEVGGLPPNSKHGFHVHQKGDCSAADASSAGDHFNPFNAPHGKASSGTHHAGDMDNITSNAQGVAKIDMHVAGVTLGGGAANDIAGRGLIVHAAPDDYQTQPTGNAGARLACAVITVTR